MYVIYTLFFRYLEIYGYKFDDPAPNLDLHGHFTAVSIFKLLLATLIYQIFLSF